VVAKVKHTGDGIMAAFLSAAAAVKCASRIQNDFAGHEDNRRERPLKVRIGAAAGEPVEHHDDLFGCTVQLAARLCSHASPEQIVVSSTIAELCLGKNLLFEDLGEIALKGFDRPVRAHAVVWASQSPQTAS
jgi:class 3 adenylate cyclase